MRISPASDSRVRIVGPVVAILHFRAELEHEIAIAGIQHDADSDLAQDASRGVSAAVVVLYVPPAERRYGEMLLSRLNTNSPSIE